MMPVKFLIAIFMLITCLFGSCRKEAISKPEAPLSIIGVWELSKEYGGFAADVIYPAGNGNILEFTEETYKEYIDNQLTRSGNYTLLKDTFLISSHSGPASYEILDRLCFGNIEPDCHRLKINDSTFVFNYGDGIVDGRERIYRKQDATLHRWQL